MKQVHIALAGFIKTRFYAVLLLLFLSSTLFADVLTPDALLGLKSIGSAEISPDGNYAAYLVYTPRKADEKAGGSYSELFVRNLQTGETIPFITGKTNVYAPKWSPDGKLIAFTTRRGDDAKNQIWVIALKGGEARQITDFKSGVSSIDWHPSGKKLAFISTEPESAREKALDDKGYGFIFYEENLKHRNLYLVDFKEDGSFPEPEQVTENITVWSFEFAKDGNRVALGASEKNLIDYEYAFQHVHILDLKTKTVEKLTNNPGKLGNFVFSPDGKHLAYAGALTQSDHAVSQAYVIPVSGGNAKNLTKENFRGHITWVNWKDNNTVVYTANEGAASTFNEVSIKNGKHNQILSSLTNGGIVFNAPSYISDFKKFIFTGSTPYIRSELYAWRPGKMPERLTDINPELATIKLGKQEVVTYKAEDGLDIEGLLIYPVDYKKGEQYPLVVLVHGGPESNYSNEWVSGYSTPGQTLAGKGYAVFYPNYRASTGYGVDFAAQGFADAAGKEFDDIRDGIKYLIKTGIADKNRVGLGGGSYGGYASGWFATYYTEYVKAVCMFVGISDLISKRGTTDIPYEELFVHSGEPLEKMWQQSLERSPIYHAHQSRTATLIYGGAADTRVHPSQSMELYRRMKMNNHPAVRLVQYPGEGHGNRRQTGQIDVLYRILDWYDWYIRDAKPLNGPMPPLDISDKYGITLPGDQE